MNHHHEVGGGRPKIDMRTARDDALDERLVPRAAPQDRLPRQTPRAQVGNDRRRVDLGDADDVEAPRRRQDARDVRQEPVEHAPSAQPARPGRLDAGAADLLILSGDVGRIEDERVNTMRPQRAAEVAPHDVDARAFGFRGPLRQGARGLINIDREHVVMSQLREVRRHDAGPRPYFHYHAAFSCAARSANNASNSKNVSSLGSYT